MYRYFNWFVSISYLGLISRPTAIENISNELENDCFEKKNEEKKNNHFKCTEEKRKRSSFSFSLSFHKSNEHIYLKRKSLARFHWTTSKFFHLLIDTLIYDQLFFQVKTFIYLIILFLTTVTDMIEKREEFLTQLLTSSKYLFFRE